MLLLLAGGSVAQTEPVVRSGAEPKALEGAKDENALRLERALLAVGKRNDASDFRGALSAIEEIIAQYPDCAKAYYYRAVAKGGSRDYVGALDDYNTAIRLDPTLDNVYNNRGNVRMRLGDNRGALEDFNAFLKKNPDHPDTLINRGNVRHRLGDFSGALSDYDTSVKIRPNAPEAYCSRGLTKEALRDESGAMADYNKAIEINDKFALAYNNRGVLKGKSDQLEAIRDYDKAIAIDSKYVEAYKNRAQAHLALHHVKETISDCDRFIEFSYRLNEEIYAVRGLAKWMAEDFKDADVDFTRAIEINPNYATALGFRGRLRESRGDKAGAKADLAKAAALSAFR